MSRARRPKYNRQKLKAHDSGNNRHNGWLNWSEKLDRRKMERQRAMQPTRVQVEAARLEVALRESLGEPVEPRISKIANFGRKES